MGLGGDVDGNVGWCCRLAENERGIATVRLECLRQSCLLERLVCRVLGLNITINGKVAIGNGAKPRLVVSLPLFVEVAFRRPQYFL
jgi:hypothetical protein